MNSAWVERYLRFLGVDGGATDMALLSQITASQARVPFENLTSLLRRERTPEGPVPPLSFEEMLEGWEAGRGGGVCYEIAGMVLELLQGVGFDAQPVHGQITFPGSHLAVKVKLDRRSWLVDCGNGAPFLEPIPLDETIEIHRAGLGFRFVPGEDGYWLQDRLIEGEWRTLCRYDLTPASKAQRDAAYQRHHGLPAESFVVDELRIMKSGGDVVLQLTNHQFTRHSAEGKQRRLVSGFEEYERLLADVFELPGLPVRDGLRAWQAVTGASIDDAGAEEPR